jgi:GNAT superfamily N-acetyltransferase
MTRVRLRWVDDPEEWQVVREVRLAALRADPGAFYAVLADEQGLDESAWRRRAGAGSTVVAVDGTTGSPVGCATVVHEEGGPPGGRHLVGMWVAPQSRGGGVATRLLDAAAGRARSQGARVLTLWVVRTNAAARGLYAARGFVESDVPPGVADYGCAGEIRMALTL